MKYDAIIFDLFGTLVDNFGGTFAAALAADGVLEELVGDRAEEFTQIWNERKTYQMRVTGVHATGADSVRCICRQMGISPEPDLLRRSQEIRTDYTSRAIDPRPGVTETLRQLRCLGVKIALMSVCVSEEASLWARSALAGLFDEAVLSCQVGLIKPDPRFYELICQRLSVQPERCLYVGDGDGKELTGATACGMDAVLICAPHEEQIVMERAEARNWTGPRIAAIDEVVGIHQRPGSAKPIMTGAIPMGSGVKSGTREKYDRRQKKSAAQLDGAGVIHVRDRLRLCGR